jgi:predicted dehydrogenase
VRAILGGNRAGLAIIFQNRWHPGVQKLKSEAYVKWTPLKAAMTVNWYRPDTYFVDWKGMMSQGGDIVFNQVIHHFDLMRFIFGEVESVFAYVRNTRPKVLSCMDVVTAVLKFRSGLIATLDATTNCYPENGKTELVVVTDRGTITIVPKGTPHLHQIRHVMECFEKGEEPEVKPEDAMETLRLVLAVHESAWSGKEVKL